MKAPGKFHRKELTRLEVADMFSDEQKAKEWTAEQTCLVVPYARIAARTTSSAGSSTSARRIDAETVRKAFCNQWKSKRNENPDCRAQAARLWPPEMLSFDTMPRI